jgi:FkbM family methyltransferase
MKAPLVNRALRWITEVPSVVSVLPFFDGVYPLMSLRFGGAKSADVRVRRGNIISIPAPISAMVFSNIWIRHAYPDPTPGDVVLDLGTNIGMFALYALSHGAKFVHCVEPSPDSVSRIQKHVKDWGFQDRVNIMKAGVAEKEGEAFIPMETNVSSTIQDKGGDGLVAVKLLDAATLLETLQPRPTYIKLDIESNEVPVLRRLVSSPAISFVKTYAMEVDNPNEAAELEALLRGAGFVTEITLEPERILIGRRP